MKQVLNATECELTNKQIKQLAHKLGSVEVDELKHTYSNLFDRLYGSSKEVSVKDTIYDLNNYFGQYDLIVLPSTNTYAVSKLLFDAGYTTAILYNEGYYERKIIYAFSIQESGQHISFEYLETLK